MYGMHIYNYKYIVNVNDKIAKFDCLFNGVTRMEMVWCDCTYPIILRSQEHTSLALYLSFGLCSTNLFYWEWFNHLNINNSLNAEERYNAFISSHKN